jgi:hypothetical protein
MAVAQEIILNDGKEVRNKGLDEITCSMINHFFNSQERIFMKNLTTLTALVAFLTMALSAGAMAQCGRMGGGPMMGGPMQFSQAAGPTPETLKKFNQETKALQEQLIDKQALLKKELLKEDPDLDAMAKLQKDIIDIQTGIQKVAKKLGMKNGYGSCCGMFMGNGCGGGCGGGGMGGGMRGCGMR